MSEIVGVFDDIKKATGEKGFLILGAVVLGVFIINLVKKDDSEAVGNTLVSASGYTSYPSVEKNADVIIDSLQKSIDYAQGSIQDQISEVSKDTNSKLDDMMSNISDQFGELGGNMTDMSSDLKDYLNDNFNATNDYIKSGLESQAELIRQNNSQLSNSNQFELIDNMKYADRQVLEKALERKEALRNDNITYLGTRDSGASDHEYVMKERA